MFLFNHQELISETEWGDQATIDTVLFTHGAFAGDTIKIITKTKANVTGQAKLRLYFDDLIQPIDPSSTFHTAQTVYLDSGHVSYDTLYVLLTSSGTSTLYFDLETDTLKSTFNILPATKIEHFVINNYPETSYKVPDDSPPIYEYTDFYEVYENLGPTGGEKNFKVNGKVNFEYTQHLTRNVEDKTFPGYVRLYFHSAGGTIAKEEFYHPINPTSTGYLEGIHYSKIDENGNFEFDFSLYCDVPPMMHWMIGIHVMKMNDIFDLYTETGNLKINNALGDPHRLILHADKYVNINNDENQNYNLNLRVMPIDGNILRNGGLCQEFLLNIYEVNEIGDLPINGLPSDEKLPQIKCELGKRTGIAAGTYSSSNGIFLVNSSLGLIGHEYGHYLNDAMGNYEYFQNHGFSFSEGFAEFFSYCVLAWVQNSYGDETGWMGNPEATPYSGKNYGTYPGFHWDRFEGCGKANLNHLNQCAFGAYLWNLYDNYFDIEYNLYHFDGENNDDVALDRKQLYEFIANKFHRDYSMENLHNDIKNVIISNIELKNSVDAIWDFMMDPDSTMRSAQCNWNHNAELFMGQWKYRIDITPRTYQESTYYDWIELVFPDLISGTYTLEHIGNNETGWKVYKQNGSDWDLIETSTTSPIRIDKITGTYYVTSYNDNAYRKNLQDNAGNSIEHTTSVLNYKPSFYNETEMSNFIEPKQFQTFSEFGVLIDEKLEIANIELFNLEGRSLNDLIVKESNRIYCNKLNFHKSAYFLSITYFYNGNKFLSTFKFIN